MNSLDLLIMNNSCKLYECIKFTMDKPKYAASGPSCFLGGTPLEKPYRHVLPQRVWFLHSLGLKKGINLAHFGLESGMAFEET